jgi:hypothetical protein
MTTEPLAEFRRRRISCRSAVVSVRAKTGLWTEQAENAVCGKDDNAEHQVTERLEMSADAEEAAAEFVLQAPIGSFGIGALIVGQVPWIGHMDQAPAGPLGGDLCLEAGIAAGVAVDVTGTRPAARQSSMIGCAS